MKKILSVFAMMAMLFASCTPEDQPGNEGGNENEGGTNNGGENTEQAAPEFSVISSASLEFTSEGGEGVISYVVTNPVNDMTVSATPSAEWVKITSITDKKAVFTVDKYESTEAARNAVITLTYGELNEEVAVTQQPAKPVQEPTEVVVNATYFAAVYYGTQYSPGYNYYLSLSDAPVQYEGDSMLVEENTHYYFLDLYSNIPVGDGEAIIPNGTYTFDNTSEGEPGTMSEEYSYYVTADAADAYDLGFISGTVVVTDGKIEAELVTSDGNIHKLTYEGSLVFEEASTGGFSTMTDDYTFKLENGYFVAESYGFIDELNQYYWIVQYVEDPETFSGDFFMFELTTDEPSVLGTYSAYSDYAESVSYVYVPGYLDEEYMMYGSWYLTLEGGSPTEDSVYASIWDGEFTISEADGVYTIEANLIDGAGNAIVGTASTPYAEIYGPEDAAYAKKARKVSAPAKSVVMKSNKNNFVLAK